METSFQASGSILGTDVKETGTYSTVVRPDGCTWAKGKGNHDQGRENGHLDRPRCWHDEKDTASYRGALYYQTTPTRLARLNKVALLFEYEVEANGNTHSEYWEWK